MRVRCTKIPTKTHLRLTKGTIYRVTLLEDRNYRIVGDDDGFTGIVNQSGFEPVSH